MSCVLNEFGRNAGPISNRTNFYVVQGIFLKRRICDLPTLMAYTNDRMNLVSFYSVVCSTTRRLLQLE